MSEYYPIGADDDYWSQPDYVAFSVCREILNKCNHKTICLGVDDALEGAGLDINIHYALFWVDSVILLDKAGDTLRLIDIPKETINQIFDAQEFISLLIDIHDGVYSQQYCNQWEGVA